MNSMFASKLTAVTVIALAGCAGEPAPSAGAADAAGRKWQVGDSFVYEIESSRTVSGGQFSSKLSGQLAITVVGEEPDGAYDLRGDVRAPRYEQSSAEDLGQELTQPFFFTVLPTGQVKGFLFSAGVSGDSASVQRELALSLQLVEPAEQEEAPASWRSIERDSTGEYEALYTRTDASVHKSKVKYLPRRGDKASSPIHGFESVTVQSSVDFLVDESRWPASVREQESTTATAGTLVVTSTKSSSARLVGVERSPALVGTMDATRLVSDIAIDAASRARAVIQANQGLVGGKTFEQLAEGLASRDDMARSHAQARMAALIRLDPGAAVSARERVVAGKGDVNTSRRFIGALGSAGTREAQRELVTIIESADVPVGRAMDAVIAIGLTKAPTTETATALQRAMKSAEPAVWRTAVLASGAVIRSMAQSSSGDTREAMNVLVQGLGGTDVDTDQVLYLDALGNTGDARAFAAIQPYLSDERASVRAAATRGMRFMANDAADKAIATALTDPELEVQKAAVGTLSHRPLAASLPAIAALLDSSPANTVRKATLGFLQSRKDELAWLSAHGATEAEMAMSRDLLRRS